MPASLPTTKLFAMNPALALAFRAAVSCSIAASAACWAQASAPVEAQVPFDILEYEIEGNSVLSVEAIEKAVTPYLGEQRSLADAEAARSALEKAYQSAGYLTVFVDLPEQRVDEGVVRLAVTEGRVDRLAVVGARYFSQGYIRDKVPELAEGKVPNFTELQRELAAVNRSEERRVQPVMRAGREPGTVEAELKVDDRLPASGIVELNNRHAAGTSPWRLSLTGRYDNLFQREHSISLTAVTAPLAPSESRVLSLNYTIPAGDDGSAWVLSLLNSNSNVEAVGNVDVVGKGTTVGLRYVKPVLTTAEQSHRVTLGVEFKNLRQDTRSGTDLISTPLRYLPFSVAYNAQVDHGEQRSSNVNLQMLASLRPVLRREVDCVGFRSDQFACERNQGDGGFATVRADWRLNLPLWKGRLQTRLGGQLATGPIPSGEQYTIGGAETVRGYPEAAGAGDRAVLGSLEWLSSERNWEAPSNTAGSSTFWPMRVAALGFFDIGRTYIIDPATGQAPRASLAGLGAGLRVHVRKSVSGEFDLAWPLKATVAAADRSPRLHIKLAVEL